jgi:large subunit ribosomal protein L10
LNRDQKAAVVDEVAGQITESEAIFAVDYRGISVPQAAELRVKLYEADASFRVIKNTLSERAADRAGAEGLKELLVGPTAMTFVRGDAAAAAKALRDFRRANNLLEFKGGWMNGAALTADEVDAIAQLPSRDVLNARLVGMVASPLTGVVTALNNLIAGFARQLQLIADQGLVGGDAPAPPAPAEEAAASSAAEADAPAAEADAPAAEADAPAADAAEASDTPSTDTPQED